MITRDLAAVPYCGAPPSPESLAGRWNLDPLLLLALIAVLGLYLVGARKAGLAPRRRAAFIAGWAVAVLALVSPLCALSVSLFAARVGQHMILTLLAAPLIALGGLFPAMGALADVGDGGLSPGGLARAAAIFGALLWFWHSPGPYAASFSSAWIYWAMHLTLIGSAVWLWAALIGAPASGQVLAIAAGLVSTVQMGLLGALITLAPRPVYAPHLLTPWTWGLSPLQDQQLGGALMWIPGCVAFLAPAMIGLWRIMSREGPHAARAAAR